MTYDRAGRHERAETNELYRALEAEARERRRRRLSDWTAQIRRLRERGLLDDLTAFTDFHFRIRRGNVELDVWPTRAKWRDRKNQKAPTQHGWRSLLRALGLNETDWGI